MKLRLPHKFQAALMAALASVSFTTLSTGSTAQAELPLQLTNLTPQQLESSNSKFNWSEDTGNLSSWCLTFNMTSSSDKDFFNLSATNNASSGYRLATVGKDVILKDNSGQELARLTSVVGSSTISLSFVLDVNESGTTLNTGTFTLSSGEQEKVVENLTSSATASSADNTYFYKNNDKVRVWTNTAAQKMYGFTLAQLGNNVIGTAVWQGTDENHTWTTTNFTPGFETGWNAQFTASGHNAVDITTSVTARAVTVAEQAYTFNLSGNGSLTSNVLAAESGLTIAGAGSVTTTGGASGNISVSSGATWKLGGGTNWTYGGVLSGAGNVEKIGAGTLTLTANNNNFTGSLTISEGTVKVTHTNALGQINASRHIEVAEGGTLDVNGNQGTGDGYTVTLSGGTITNTGTEMNYGKRQYVTHLNLTGDSKAVATRHFGLIGSNYAATSMAMGGHTLTIEGPGTYYVNNATIAGGGQFKVASGTLEFNTGTNDSQKGSFASNFELAGGTLTGNTLKLASDIYINTTGNSSMSLPVQRQGHAITFKGNANLSVSGNLTGAGSIAKEGSGALTITGSLDVNSTIRLDGGSLALGGTVTVNSASIGSLEVFDDTSQTYSYAAKNSGFLTSAGQYYLVKGGQDTTATLTGNVSGATVVAEPTKQKGAGDIIITFENPSATTYFVNENMATGEDAAITSTAKDIAIKAGATLTASASSAAFSTAKLQGEGTYALASGASALNSGLSLGTDWTGTVVISNAAFTNQGLSNALNNARNSLSWVKAKGLSGWNNTTTINANLILENGDSGTAQGWAYMQDNGNTGQTLTFAGMIKGDGKMGRSNDKGTVFTYEFTNDISGWTGTFESRSQSGGSTTFRVKDNATVVNAILDNKLNNLYVDVQNNATFNAEIKNATKLTIATGKTATLAASATLGSLAGAGALVVDSGSNTVTITGAGGNTGLVTVDSGTLALGANGVLGGSLTINDGALVTTQRNNGTGFVAGTVTINAGGTLQATGGQDIFGYEGGATDKVVMQGSSTEKQAKIDLTAVTSGSVTMTTDLEMKGHSTISGGTINAFGGNIAVSGTNNTISGFAMRNAVTIDVAAEGALEIGALSRFSATSGALTKTGDGTLTLKGGVIDKAITLGAGELVLDGSFTVDGLDPVGEPTVYYTGAEDYLHRTNGVRGGQLDLQLLTAGSAGSLSIADASRFTYDSQTMTGSVGEEPGTIHLVSEGFSSTFYINEASERTGWIFRADTDYPATDISIARGATLVVDDNAAGGFSASKIHVQDGTGSANLQIATGNKVNADGTDRALQLSGAGTYKLNSGVALGSLSTAADGTWTGTIDATEIGSDKDKLFALYTTSAVHGGTVLLKTVTGDPTSGDDSKCLTLQLAGDGGKTGDHTFARTTFKTEGSGNLKIADWQRAHSWIVGEGTAFDVDGAIRVDNLQTLSIRGGSVTTGGKIVLGHDGSGNASGLNMTSGSLKTSAIQVIIGGTGNAAPISITGGTLEFTSATPLLLNNNSAATVTLGGSGDNFVTLKADTVSWSLAHEGMTIGNIMAETTNGGAITLGAAGKGASYTGSIEVAENSSLTLDGTISMATAGSSIAVTGALTIANSVVFNLDNFAHQSEGGSGTYTLFSGNGPNLTGLNEGDVLSHITGNVITAGRTWTFGDNGTLSYTINSRDLVWNGGAGTWTTATTETPWHVNGELQSTNFNNGDAVTFAYTAEPAVATLGSDVTVSTMTLDSDTPDVTVNNDGSYSFNVEELDINSGRLTTNTAITVKHVNIASGAEWALGGTLDLDTVSSFSNEGVLRVLDGVELRVHKGSTAESVGTVTADEGGTLYVDNGGGQGDAGYTYHGVESAPFKGTLVYDVVSSGNHDVSIALENFQGTLELRGRLAASASNFGGMTKLVLNGDRSSNTTGLWNQNELTLNVPVDIVGENTVDLYTSAALTINGTVNGGTEKQGHLGKQNDGALTFNGAVALADFTTPGGTVNFNDSASLDATYINGGTVNLNGGAGKDYNLGVVNMGGGSLAIGAQGVKSLTATDLVVRSSYTLSSAAAEPTVFNVTRFDVSNHNTNMTLQNVTLNVSGAATAAVLNTAQANDQATVTVGDKATLNLDGGVVWRKVDEKDASKTDYVNLTINNGGAANINAGTENVLNDVTVNAGGALSFGTGTTTTVAGTLTLNDTLTNSGSLTLGSGTVAANQTGTIAGSGTVTLNGTIGGAGTFKLDGATLTGGTNAAVSGNMVIDGGTLAGTMSIGSNSANTVRVTEVFTVQDGANVTFNGTMVLDDLADVTVIYTDAERDVEKNGFITGVSARVFNIAPGSESVIFAGGQPTYKGITGTIVDGVFSKGTTDYTTFFVNVATETAETYSHALAMADAGKGDFTKVELAAGTSFDIDQDAILNTVTVTGGSASLIGSGTLSLGTDDTAVSLTGAGSLVINGPTVTINGANQDYTGNIDVLSGTLKLGADSNGYKHVLGAYTQAGSGRTITVHEGAVLDLNGKADNNYVFTLAGGTFTNTGNGVGNGSSQTVGLVLTDNSFVGDTEHTGQFWLRNRGSGTTTLSLDSYTLTKQGGSTFGLYATTVTGTGAIDVAGGTLEVQGGGFFGANLVLSGGTVSGTLNLAGSTVITTTAASTFSAAISTNGHGVTFNGDLNLAATGALTGNGGVTKNGTGTLELTTVNNYGGAFTVNAGKLLITTTTEGLPGTLTATGDGELHLRIAQGTSSQNVDLKTVNATNLHLVADSDHNSRFNYKDSNSNLNGVEHLYFDGGQLWLSGKDMTGDNKFTGNVTFNTATVYSESSNIFDHAAMRISRNAEFAGTVDVKVDTRLGWGNDQDKTLEISRELVGSGNLELESYNNNTNGTLKISGDASDYQGATTSNSHITLQVAEGGKMNLATGSNLAGAVQLDAGGKMTVSGDSTISGAINGSGSLEVKKDATLNYNRTAETTVAAQLSGEGTLQYTGTGTTKFTGDVSGFSGNVDVQAGELNIMNIAQATSLNVKDVTIAANATMGVYNSDNATPGTANEGTLTMKSGSTLKAGGANATLNANLVMEAGSKLDVSGTGGTGLIMGSTVTLNQGNLLTVGGSTDVDSYLRSYFGGDTTKLYTLYSGEVGDPIELYIGDQKMDAITFDAWNKPFMDASSIYSNLQEKTYYLVYNPDHNNVGMVAIGFVPEPATSTLSLLALCALAARRRRR